MTSRTINRKRPEATPKVGSIVGVRFGAHVVPARVIEDRGNLGVGGQRIVRVETHFEPEPTLIQLNEPMAFELPVEDLEDIPTS